MAVATLWEVRAGWEIEITILGRRVCYVSDGNGTDQGDRKMKW